MNERLRWMSYATAALGALVSEESTLTYRQAVSQAAEIADDMLAEEKKRDFEDDDDE